jgi:hypothetical protein
VSLSFRFFYSERELRSSQKVVRSFMSTGFVLYKSAAATVPATATAAVTSPAEEEIAPEPFDVQMFLVLTLPGQVFDVSVQGTN